MAIHSSILAWRIPWTQEPGGLQSIGSQSQTQLKRLSTAQSAENLKKPERIRFRLASLDRVYDPHMESLVVVLVAQSCLTLCNPTDCSLPGSCVHGILQARILEWVAMPSSRGSSRPRDRICTAYVPALADGSLPLAPPSLAQTLIFPFVKCG